MINERWKKYSNLIIKTFTITTDNEINPNHGQLHTGHTDVRGSGGLCMTLGRRSNYFYYLLIIFLYFFIKCLLQNVKISRFI